MTPGRTRGARSGLIKGGQDALPPAEPVGRAPGQGRLPGREGPGHRARGPPGHVELVAVAVSDPQKVRYGGLAEKEGVDEGSRVGRLRRTTEAALVKTWSYELAATTRYKGVGEAMRVEGGGLRRTVEDFQS